MARYRATDVSERRTASLRGWVTPTEKKAFAARAAQAGTPLSEYVRELCLTRLQAAPVVAGTTRNPTAKVLADELRAIGINLNQLTRIANQTGALRKEAELDQTLDAIKAAVARVIAL